MESYRIPMIIYFKSRVHGVLPVSVENLLKIVKNDVWLRYLTKFIFGSLIVCIPSFYKCGITMALYKSPWPFIFKVEFWNHASFWKTNKLKTVKTDFLPTPHNQIRFWTA